MFEYKIYCGDYSMAGYSENLTYSGINREKAIKAYRDAKNWLGIVRIEISVLGREKHFDDELDCVNELDYIEDEESAVDCYIFEDESHGFVNPFSDTPEYDLDIFQEYAGHGKITFHYIGTAKGECITEWVREFDSH